MSYAAAAPRARSYSGEYMAFYGPDDALALVDKMYSSISTARESRTNGTTSARRARSQRRRGWRRPR